MSGDDLASVARSIIDANLYMVLGTADEDGNPWVSPVYFAPAGYGEFFWVSSPDARHSRNIAARPEIGVVIFDSGAPIGTGQGVYMAALADEVAEDERARGLEVFSRRSAVHGGRPWTPADVMEPAPHRLYRATASEHWVLDPEARPDQRTPVAL